MRYHFLSQIDTVGHASIDYAIPLYSTTEIKWFDYNLEIVPAADTWLIQVRGRLQPRVAAARTGVFVALYQDGLSSQVTAGENAARRLRHERVTRELIGPLPVAADGSFIHSHRFRLPVDARPRDLGVAAFVQDRTDGRVWQALALAACLE